MATAMTMQYAYLDTSKYNTARENIITNIVI